MVAARIVGLLDLRPATRTGSTARLGVLAMTCLVWESPSATLL
jgi:hypothetical protein